MNYRELQKALKQLREQGIYRGKLSGKGVTKAYLQEQYEFCTSRKDELLQKANRASELNKLYVEKTLKGTLEAGSRLATTLYKYEIDDNCDELLEKLLTSSQAQQIITEYFYNLLN